MNGLGFNKIAGAVLATLFVIVGLRELSSIIFPDVPAAKPGYAIAVAEDSAGGAAPVELPTDWGSALPTADVKAGQSVAQKCQACHILEKGGANMTGPNLYGVLGRKPGSHPGYAYSSGMMDFAGKNPAWTYDLIDTFLKGPQKDISGTKMTFVGLKQQADRVNLIAYLRTLNDSPPPIPAPKPAAAAAPAAAAPGAAPAGKPAVVATTKPAASAPATAAAAPKP